MSAPAAPPPPHPPLPGLQAVAYMLAATVIGLSQGLQQGFVSTSLPQLAGDLGITTTSAAWLLAVYMIPRAALPVLLIKIRTQYGLRRFAELGIILYALVALASLWAVDFRSALVLQFLAGAAAAPLSTLAFLYMLEPLSPQAKMTLGLPLAMTVLMTGPTLARVVGPYLIGDGGMTAVHVTGLGMALVSLMLVFCLPLRPIPRQKVIEPLDFASFVLIGAGFGGLIVAFVMGPIYNWTDVAWIGWLLAGAALSLTLAVVVELNRTAPLLDIRWLASPAILHLTGTLFLFRLILSEQSAGAPRMFQVLGVAPQQMTVLFAVIALASLMGALACIAWMRPTRVPQFHLAALLLIAAGAWLDSGAGVLTRPAQMVVSQALIGFAAMLFMPPAMMAGLLSALAKGPQYILSFVIVFISTQSLGGVLGSGLFNTFTTRREALHLQDLSVQLTATDPATVATLAGRAAMLAAQIPDAAARRAQAATDLGQQVAAQAWVSAYADAYALTALAALLAAAVLLLHLLRDVMARRAAVQNTGTTP
ncbi:MULTISPECIES: MFS transporter [Paracoccus]|jgi:MFS family permease|uniref:MFS transporter n=1 Tax=Paracoccus haeundaensis TaxID=225362 RepID=A0A5C4R6V5_9RHOB|nr:MULTISPECIES: MFS transporter [Paracoccus]AZY94675.1 MFS transporter [Paracoccus sp. Arc7-R13]MBF5078816.1 MFS transporter [Paracoccus sp. NBH48]QXI63100.1 Multidrug export protein EmrB [Paracoccus marcusii]TNH39662.1 MFS transporter [Paracoccus haeundaensis]